MNLHTVDTFTKNYGKLDNFNDMLINDCYLNACKQNFVSDEHCIVHCYEIYNDLQNNRCIVFIDNYGNYINYITHNNKLQTYNTNILSYDYVLCNNMIDIVKTFKSYYSKDSSNIYIDMLNNIQILAKDYYMKCELIIEKSVKCIKLENMIN